MLPLIIMGGPVVISTTTRELLILEATFVASKVIKSNKKNKK